MTRILGLALVLALAASGAAAARDQAPALTADQARQLLSMSGANVGTTKLLQGVGLVRIEAIDVRTEGRWVVIRVLPERMR